MDNKKIIKVSKFFFFNILLFFSFTDFNVFAMEKCQNSNNEFEGPLFVEGQENITLEDSGPMLTIDDYFLKDDDAFDEEVSSLTSSAGTLMTTRTNSTSSTEFSQKSTSVMAITPSRSSSSNLMFSSVENFCDDKKFYKIKSGRKCLPEKSIAFSIVGNKRENQSISEENK